MIPLTFFKNISNFYLTKYENGSVIYLLLLLYGTVRNLYKNDTTFYRYTDYEDLFSEEIKGA